MMECATWKTSLAEDVGLVKRGLASIDNTLRVLRAGCKTPWNLVGV